MFIDKTFGSKRPVRFEDARYTISIFECLICIISKELLPMQKTLLLITFLLVGFFSNSQDLFQIRAQYPLAQESEELTSQLHDKLAQITTGADPVMIAYKGAVKTLMADFAKKVKEKKEYFKEGVEMIETALKAEPNNIEIRYLRLTIQEHAPKFLKYHDNISEDKEFILKSYTSISSKELKAVIRDFILESRSFDEEEKKPIGL